MRTSLMQFPRFCRIGSKGSKESSELVHVNQKSQIALFVQGVFYTKFIKYRKHKLERFELPQNSKEH